MALAFSTRSAIDLMLRSAAARTIFSTHSCMLLVGHQRVHEFTVDLDVVGLEDIENLEPLLVNAVVLERESNAHLA